jgi:hypothetical protein
MNRSTRSALMAALFALPAVVCAQQQASSEQNDIAARIGDRIITIKEVDEAWKNADPGEYLRAIQMTYDGRRQTIERLVADALIASAAKGKGVSVDQYTKEEVAKRTRPVSDAEVETFYNANKARMQGKTLADMQVPIRNFLSRQSDAKARDALIADLRKSAPVLRVMIEPPRQAVEVAQDDPVRGPAGAPVTVVEFSDYQ